jgi:hypothetical protein
VARPQAEGLPARSRGVSRVIERHPRNAHANVRSPSFVPQPERLLEQAASSMTPSGSHQRTTPPGGRARRLARPPATDGAALRAESDATTTATPAETREAPRSWNQLSSPNTVSMASQISFAEKRLRSG